MGPPPHNPAPIPASPSFRFGRTRRLTHNREFQAMYRSGARQNVGPLVIFSLPNGLAHPRLGLAVSRKVGKAHDRNRIKRRLREAFRLEQHALAPGYDYLIRVRPHGALGLDDYRRRLTDAATKLERTWSRRARRDAEREGAIEQPGADANRDGTGDGPSA